MIEIEIGGKKRKFSFGLEVLGWIQYDSGLDLTEAQGKPLNSLFFILMKPLIYRGHERELKKEGKQVDYTYEDVERWIEEKGRYHKDVLLLWASFNEALVDRRPATGEDRTATEKKR